MKCPRCENSVLKERERDGVTINVCRHCRAIWLDNGELERFIVRAVEDRDTLDHRNGEERED